MYLDLPGSADIIQNGQCESRGTRQLIAPHMVSTLLCISRRRAICAPSSQWYFARRVGVRYARHPGLARRRCASGSGVLALDDWCSLVTVDNWILAHMVASIKSAAAVSLMSYASNFHRSYAMLRQAAGAASMPFFASLWTQEKRYAFCRQCSRFSFACAGPQPPCGLRHGGGWPPAIDLSLPADAHRSRFPGMRCLLRHLLHLMFLWSARPSMRAPSTPPENNVTPAIAGTIVTVVSWPIYLALFHWQGAMGLAIASDVGIALQTLTIAMLLHTGHMVSLASLDFVELGRCLLAAAASSAAAWATVWAVDSLLLRMPSVALLLHTRGTDLLVLVAGSAVWLAVLHSDPRKSGSALPRVAMKRLRLA